MGIWHPKHRRRGSLYPRRAPNAYSSKVAVCHQGEGNDHHQRSRSEKLRRCTFGPTLEVGSCGNSQPSSPPKECGTQSIAETYLHISRSGSASSNASQSDLARSVANDSTVTLTSKHDHARNELQFSTCPNIVPIEPPEDERAGARTQHEPHGVSHRPQPGNFSISTTIVSECHPSALGSAMAPELRTLT